MKCANKRKIRGFTAFYPSFRGQFRLYFLMRILTRKLMRILMVFDVNLPKLAGGQFALYDRREESADISDKETKNYIFLKFFGDILCSRHPTS
jgi:hypothetical protein